LKVFDYLASGVPVVATDLPALRDLGHPVRVANGDFIDAIEATLRAPARADECRELAAANSWLERARRLDDLMLELADAALHRERPLHAAWRSLAAL
jgi:hypothetical protein